MSKTHSVPQMKPWFDGEELGFIRGVLNKNWITEGEQTALFGEEFNQYIGAQYGVFAPNGTLALFLGLLALGIKSGDEVIVPNSTFIASANAVILAGATPVFVDVEPNNFQISIDECEKIITKNTKAIMPVHLFGTSANMDKVMRFAKKHKIKVIEDACQGVGVFYKNKHVGTFGDIGCFSFFADKTITTGEGGYVVCKSKTIYKKLLLLRNQGRFNRGSFIHPSIGYNFRITDIQAAIGRAQFKKLPKIIENKNRILGWYKDGLKNLESISLIEPQKDSTYIPFRVVIFCKEAKRLTEYLTKNSIQPRSFFYPLNKQPCFKHLSTKNGKKLDLSDKKYPNSILAYKQGICLPVYPTLSKKDVDYIISKIKSFYGI